ncbi:MAG TPA: hypothetical protein VL126_04175 [Bacteroidota bacterium]|nr:hypothetical protein [Bacteroidota bacterium]
MARSGDSTAKRLVFWVVTLIAPVAALLLLEGALRLLGLFAQEPLLVTITDGGEEYYQLNPAVANRYFDSHRVSVPNLRRETFPKHKRPETFRVFCLGESTTAGFPFDGQVPFPKQLQLLLTRAFPRRHIEVINTGISAMSSYTVLDMLPEILDTSPDLLIVYLGHNEFYGAYGSGSTVSLGGNESLVRFFLKIQKLRLAQMVRLIVQWGGGFFAHPDPHMTLMGAVVREQESIYHSPSYWKAHRAFASNLDCILNEAEERGVHVIISTLFSNVRDQEPLLARPAPGKEKASVLAIQSAERLRKAGEDSLARRALAEAESADSLNAALAFQFGRVVLEAGDTAQAAEAFYRAKDHDLMRFRASEDVNAIIAQKARAHGATLTDMHEIFRSHSNGRLIGSALLCDHLHPNPDGYYLMARAFYQSILETRLLGNPDSAFTPQESPYHVTDLDWNIGLLKIFEMTRRWPFPERPVVWSQFRAHGDPTSTRFALEYLATRLIWPLAHDSMAAEEIRRGAYEAAREEYRAISVFAPEDPTPHLDIARTYESQQMWAERESALADALSRSPLQGMVLYQMALCQWKLGNLPRAIRTMEAASEAPEFHPAQRHNALFYLAGFLSDSRRPDAAVKVLQLILAEDPSFEPARIFLAKLQRSASRQP